MNVTLFGGSFNPPHLGHALVIQQAFELIPGMDELWILPAYRHTFLKDLAPAHHRLKMCELLIQELQPMHLLGVDLQKKSAPVRDSTPSEGSQFSQAAMASPAVPDGQAFQRIKASHAKPSAAKKIVATRTRESFVRLESIEFDHQLSGETYDALQLLKAKYPQHHFSFLMGSDQIKSFKKWGNWQELLTQMPFYVYPRAGYTNATPFPNMTLLTSPTQVVTNISSTLIRQRIAAGLPIAHLVPSAVLKYLRLHRVYGT